MKSLPAILSLEQARDVLTGMSDGQEICAGRGEFGATIVRHTDHQYSASLPEMETGTISLRDASHILLEYGDHDLRLEPTPESRDI